jgi:hypothetical protein
VSKLSKALKRDRKINRKRSGHQVDNKGIFLLEEQKYKRAEKEKGRKKKKWEAQRESDETLAEDMIKKGVGNV